jgi:hypothetical protein
VNSQQKVVSSKSNYPKFSDSSNPFQMLAELTPLPGSIVEDWKRCGRPSCKCAQGELHGPYLVRVWYEGGKRRKAYVKASDAPRVRASIELRELERRAAKIRHELGRRISQRSYQLNQKLLESVEAEIEALRALRFTGAK